MIDRKTLPLSQLIPSEKNPRTITPEAKSALRASLERYGLVQDVVFNRRSGRVVGGHQRLEVLRDMGVKEVPTTIVDLDDADEDALRIHLNNPESQGTWTHDVRAILDNLRTSRPDVFAEGRFGELRERLAHLRDPDPEEMDEEDDDLGDGGGDGGEECEPMTCDGEIIGLGRHKLVCGDSSDEVLVQRALSGRKIDVLFTSPPYAQQRSYDDDTETPDWDELMRGVFTVADKISHDKTQWLINLGVLHKDGAVWNYERAFLDWAASIGWKLFATYIWDKGIHTPGENHGRLGGQHEYVYHLNKISVPAVEWVPCVDAGKVRGHSAQRNKSGSVRTLSTPGLVKTHKYASSVARVTPEMDNTDAKIRSHPARFPVGLPEYFIRSWAGTLVYDPFMGSGSTFIASDRLNRECIGVEISPMYCDIVRYRIEKYLKRLDGDEDSGDNQS